MRYSVAVPITGVINIEVDADSEEEAIDAAISHPDLNLDQVDEWDAHRVVVEGNIFHGHQNRAEVTNSWSED